MKIKCGLSAATLCLIAVAICYAQTTKTEAEKGGTVHFDRVLGLTFIHARVNGSKPLSMALDSGASYTILTPAIAAELGLKSQGGLQAGGFGKGADQTLHLVKNVTLSFAGQTLTGQTIATLPLDYIDREAGQPTDGLLGAPIFQHFVVHEDYATKTITLIPPAEFTPPAGFTSVPLLVTATVSLLQLQVQALNGEKTSGAFLLDSGGVGTVIFMKAFLDVHPALKDQKLLQMPGVSAVGGALHISMGRLASLRLGPFAFQKPTAVFLATNSGKANSMLAGIVGNGILRRFDVIFDYPHGKLWLKPNADISKPFPAIPSGIMLGVVPPDFHRINVHAVIAGSPAEKAGVLAGDTILAMSHHLLSTSQGVAEKSTSLSLAEVHNFLNNPGQQVYLRLDRNGKQFVVHFTTKNLL
ncbi:MAG TPA: aspartyl protease family protein [Acidobacteriaceae bacterium]|nr:aspartyl protease family protein [Acidobacteriaceae bacterium]